MHAALFNEGVVERGVQRLGVVDEHARSVVAGSVRANADLHARHHRHLHLLRRRKERVITDPRNAREIDGAPQRGDPQNVLRRRRGLHGASARELLVARRGVRAERVRVLRNSELRALRNFADFRRTHGVERRAKARAHVVLALFARLERELGVARAARASGWAWVVGHLGRRVPVGRAASFRRF